MSNGGSICEVLQLGTSTCYPAPTALITTSASVALISIVIIAANALRRGLIIYNNSANSAYLTYGPTSVSNACTRILATFTQFESLGPCVYTGQISAIRNAGSGTLTITELW